MPRLDDDGTTVTLDLHGATVTEAVDLSVQTVRLAARRGRTSVRLIHGASTTRQAPHRRTIKRALYAELDEGGLGAAVTQALRMENVLVLSLDVTAASDSTPLRLRDVT